MKYRKKPVVIDAVLWDGNNAEEVEETFPGWLDPPADELPPMLPILIDTLEGEMRCDVGDYIIRGVAGEFYPCKPEIFEQTYEPVWNEGGGVEA